MMYLGANLAVRASLQEAGSALPWAPVVADERAPSRVRAAIADVLYRTAGAVDPAAGRPRRSAVRRLGVSAR